MKLDYKRLEIPELDFKQASLPVKTPSEIIKRKLILSDKLLLIFKLKLEVSKTPLTTSKDKPTPLKLMLKELELIYQLPESEMTNSPTILEFLMIVLETFNPLLTVKILQDSDFLLLT